MLALLSADTEHSHGTMAAGAGQGSGSSWPVLAGAKHATDTSSRVVAVEKMPYIVEVLFGAIFTEIVAIILLEIMLEA